MRWAYFFTGWFFFLLGAAGVLLPVLPTTPFMLLALWCFSNSSERFHHWLYHHRFFGPPLQSWKKYRVIPLPAKIMSVLVMLISYSYLLLFRQLATIWLVISGVLMAYGAWFILTKPSKPEPSSDSPQSDVSQFEDSSKS